MSETDVTAEVRPKGDLLQSVRRACSILHVLADERRALTAREISARLGLNVTTCYHLLNTLDHEGFLQRDGNRRFCLGHRIGELHDAFEAMLAPNERLVELLAELNQRTGETSYLGAWDGDDVVSVAVREGRGGVRVPGLYLGYRDHAYARAVGRALLAYRGDEFIASYLARTPLERLTDRTTTDSVRLGRCLATVRKLGYAVDLEEFTQGVCCAAAPIFDRNGFPLASFSVSVPKARFDMDGTAIINAVKQSAGAATAELTR